MKHKTLRIVVTLALGAISFWVHWITWTRWMSLSWTCGTAVLILALIGLVWRGYDADAEAVTEGRMTDPALPYSLGDWFRVGLGLALAWAGYQALLAQALLLALTAAIALAYAWRPYVDRRAVDFGRAEGLAALALILLGSAWLRLYEIGDVPYGFTIPDEPLLMIKAIDYANGLRETFARGPGSILDGVVPFYIQAAFIKLFGPTIFVYRLQAALLGLLLVLMMYKFVALSGQRFLAVAAAGFMGLSLWPVVFSRAQYLMNETYLVILGSLLFLVWAWRKGSGLAFALSGLCLGLSLSVYKSAQLGFAYLPLLGGLLFVSSPIRRERFSWGWAPFLTGFILGSAFLLQWFIQHPAQAQFDYFRQMQATHTAGVGVTSTTLLGQLDQVLGRTLPRFTALMQMYTSRGPDIPFYFPKDHPVLGPVSVFFALTGLGIAFIRFRFWLASFSVLLFFIGLLPALAGNPAYTLNERRSMISMLAIAVIAGLGLWGMAVAFASGLPALWRKRALLALLALSFMALGVRTGRDYFRYQTDHGFLTYNRANNMAIGRAAADAARERSSVILSFWCPCTDSWAFPMANPTHTEMGALTRGIPYESLTLVRGYTADGGIFGALGKVHPPAVGKPYRDVVMILTPFHFYLEPLLVRAVGAERVASVPLVQSDSGPVQTDIGMALHLTEAARILRIREWVPAAAAGLGEQYGLPYTITELAPPKELGSIESARDLVPNHPAYGRLNEHWNARPGAWRKVSTHAFLVPDPWFWGDIAWLPGRVRPPMVLSGDWLIDIPTDGEYSFGASSTAFVKIKIGDKVVYARDPDRSSGDRGMKMGALGDPVMLKAGRHRFQVDQFTLSSKGRVSQVLRVLMKAPGGEVDTLPIELLSRAPTQGRP